ncbi:UDP-N-acetylmuramoyl-L-alanine--D-glutamate ligase [Candidatus Chloroploca sp. M-50]|uniref:UDP-N-acetylmuramoylalanine--D-glutamate ligase n=1 Tax=Candidatus Chloroploca mongolica TaxID=2528176 RepID=A0ABS4D563_9CHLR|nr:UDP-N-acetylmuramoyl-L-alanine--D-glutamate ligase [Candidatus Chloroploca mongolica]MBP1464581.1 UDP-N-acetylmuramoyl-L-alanine--D-glutamate ligase [Candidatus Chloroploca mongolica]
MQWSDKHVLVMGLGIHGGGLGVARWLLAQGAQVTVTDLAERELLASSLEALDAAASALGTSVHYTLGRHEEADLAAADLVVVNPAVRPDSPWLARAAELGVPVETEMTIFLRTYGGPVLGVTGTKGKTTTALMLAAMLRERYPATLAAGNLRVSALEALEHLPKGTPVVLELSSFQLERMGAVGLSPQYSLLTNFSGDHLNWHGTLEAYAAAKRQIYWHQHADGAVVLNGADDGSVDYYTLFDEQGARRGGQAIWVGAGPHWSRVRSHYPQPSVRDVSTRVELRHEEVIWYDAGGRSGSATPVEGEVLFRRSDLRVPGWHNLANAMQAAALARAFGLDSAAIQHALQHFTGVEHRLELVRELDGIHYVNDTTATNPAATIAALEALTTPLVLIAGGADKALEFTSLGAAIAHRVKALILLEGTATTRLAGTVALHRRDLPVVGPFLDLGMALSRARELAEPGDTVLLSPGCASFGMFRNEFHRGDMFRQHVAALMSQQEADPPEQTRADT